jgi:signal transduction histidine kinase
LSTAPAAEVRPQQGASQRLQLATGAAVGAVGAMASWAFFQLNQVPLLVGYHVVAWIFVLAGMLAWRRRPDNATGPLLMACGALLWIGPMGGTSHPVTFTMSMLLNSWFAPVPIYVVLAFPRGRLSSRYDAMLVAITAVTVFVQDVGVTVIRDPAAQGCSACPANLALIASRPELADTLYLVHSTAVIVSATALIAPRLVRRWLRATSPGRRTLGPLVLSTSTWICAHALVRFTEAFLRPEWISTTYHPFNQAVMATIPLAFLFGLGRARARRSRLGDLVVELGSIRSAERLRPALARTLGDPALDVGFWSAEHSGYLTADGARLDVGHDDMTRAATFLESHGKPLAVIMHDAALLDDPRLIEASGAATRMAVENERLQAEVRAQLEEVRASRARIVEAGDAERKRVERNLHDGAQQRLVTLALQLRMLADALGPDASQAQRQLLEEARAEARAAHEELRELAQGLHPSVLSDDGLAAAVEFLAERAPIPVRVAASASRYPEAVEAAAFYVVAEALTNTVKHAAARAATIRVRAADGVLRVEVSDDGRGGAEVDGSGLRGIADRVAALDGQLTIDSPAGRGTTVRAELPCA